MFVVKLQPQEVYVKEHLRLIEREVAKNSKCKF